MVIDAPSAPLNRLRAWAQPRVAERRSALTRQWDSPAKLLLLGAVSAGVALLITGLVLILAVSSSLAWAVLLVPCLLAWGGMLKTFGLIGTVKTGAEVAVKLEAVEAEPAKAPAARRPRAKPRTTAARKPQSSQG